MPSEQVTPARMVNDAEVVLTAHFAAMLQLRVVTELAPSRIQSTAIETRG